MKNIQFTSRQTDYKLLVSVFKVIGFLVIAGCVGWCLIPAPPINGASLITAATSVGSALFAWSTFQFIRPARYDRDWQIAGVVLVPLFWLLLTLAINLCLICIARDDQNSLPFNTITALA